MFVKEIFPVEREIGHILSFPVAIILEFTPPSDLTAFLLSNSDAEANLDKP